MTVLHIHPSIHSSSAFVPHSGSVVGGDFGAYHSRYSYTLDSQGVHKMQSFRNWFVFFFCLPNSTHFQELPLAWNTTGVAKVKMATSLDNSTQFWGELPNLLRQLKKCLASIAPSDGGGGGSRGDGVNCSILNSQVTDVYRAIRDLTCNRSLIGPVLRQLHHLGALANPLLSHIYSKWLWTVVFLQWN